MRQQPERWQVLGQRTVHNGPGIRLTLVDVRSNSGARFETHIVDLSPVAIALIVNDRGEALMLWRHRLATEQWGYELPGGLVEPDEEPAATAAREATEECGWRPLGVPEPLVSFDPLPGQVRQRMEAFLWRQAERVGEPSDPDEPGRVEWVPLSSVPGLVQTGELLGAGTLVALLYYLAKG
jgi:ADP-ribose pyrophosphatase